jgi:hypothetical protein
MEHATCVQLWRPAPLCANCKEVGYMLRSYVGVSWQHMARSPSILTPATSWNVVGEHRCSDVLQLGIQRKAQGCNTSSCCQQCWHRKSCRIAHAICTAISNQG